MENNPRIIAEWEGDGKPYRVVARRFPGSRGGAAFTLEQRYKDALGNESWRANQTDFDGEEPFLVLLRGIERGQYELVKK
jgi:hypothetical protein